MRYVLLRFAPSTSSSASSPASMSADGDRHEVAGVVDEHVDAAEALGDRRGERLDVGAAGDVAAQRRHALAELARGRPRAGPRAGRRSRPGRGRRSAPPRPCRCRCRRRSRRPRVRPVPSSRLLSGSGAQKAVRPGPAGRQRGEQHAGLDQQRLAAGRAEQLQRRAASPRSTAPAAARGRAAARSSRRSSS